MKKFLTALAACTIVLTSAFIDSKVNAGGYGKAVFLGDYGVGKAQIINRFCEDHPEESVWYPYSDFTKVTVNVNNSESIIDLLDTADQERFKSTPVSCLHGADVAVVCCNYGDKSSFDSIKDWVNWVRENSNCKIILIANTTIVDNNKNQKDLSPSDRKFSEEDVKTLGMNLGVDNIFSAVSSKSGCNINELVQEIGHMVYNLERNDYLIESIDISDPFTDKVECC